MSHSSIGTERVGDGSALVIGGSLAGLLAARVLGDHYARVTIIERDKFADGPSPRRGVPQARHQHALLKRGQLIIEKLFPGIRDELIAAGAPTVDMAGDFQWLTAAGWAVRFPSELLIITCSRDLLEWSIRRRLLSHPRVRFIDGTAVTGLLARADGNGVAGVSVVASNGYTNVNGDTEELHADLVVDASGRGSRAPQWLEALGFDRAEETVITSHIGYASRIYRREPGRPRDCKGVYLQPSPPEFTRAGIILPLEGDRWHVTLTGGSRDYPPTDPTGFDDFAFSLRSPLLYDIIRSAEALSPISGFRATENRLRHFDRVARWPDGLVVLGDAACAFNPVYAQGMTTAALAANALDECIREQRLTGDVCGIARNFQRRLAKVCAPAWMLATGEDYRYRGVEGGSPTAVTRVMHWYMDRVVQLTTERADVRRVLLEVFNMVRPPSALFRPDIVARVLLPGRVHSTIAPTSARPVSRQSSNMARL
jgi:2-polyprenyl-6-methoxyphenol hydroxylase-like FAD-dependent oxidoreductase